MGSLETRVMLTAHSSSTSCFACEWTVPMPYVYTMVKSKQPSWGGGGGGVERKRAKEQCKHDEEK